jgi:hypothetical protein
MFFELIYQIGEEMKNENLLPKRRGSTDNETMSM